MSFQDLATAATTYFPELQIKYKDQSPFMQALGKILFFNPGFMTDYTTTIGYTVYFPTESYTRLHSVSASVVLMHELVHMYDQKKITRPLFAFSYLLPQILAPIFLLLLFVLSWKIVIPLALLCLLPFPAVFRMHWEKRAYISSLYTMYLLGKRLNFDPQLDIQEKDFLPYFQGPPYYYMWPFNNINSEFEQAAVSASAGQRPYQDAVFDMLEDLATKA